MIEPRKLRRAPLGLAFLSDGIPEESREVGVAFPFATLGEAFLLSVRLRRLEWDLRASITLRVRKERFRFLPLSRSKMRFPRFCFWNIRSADGFTLIALK